MIDRLTGLMKSVSGVMNNVFKPALILITMIAGVLLFLRLPLFFISDIVIEGNSRLTDDYIKQAMDIRSDEAIFFWNAPMARRRLRANQYVDRVDITLDYFSRRVTVQIRERILSGYVEYVEGIFLYIDERGRVLESATSFSEPLPIVVGLTFSEFTVGELLTVDNPASFELVVTLAQLLNMYQMSGDVIRVDVSKTDDIHLYIRNIDVEFGGITGADEKIRKVKEILDNHLDDDERGFLNIRDPDRPPRFRPLQ